jgi:hypothetical protein
MTTPMTVSTDVTRLRQAIAVPPEVQSVRWIAATVATHETSGLPGPSDLRLYAALDMDTPEARQALDLAMGPAIGVGTFNPPAEVAQALLSQPLQGVLRKPGNLATGGQFRIVCALQLQNAVFVAAFTT